MLMECPMKKRQKETHRGNEPKWLVDMKPEYPETPKLRQVQLQWNTQNERNPRTYISGARADRQHPPGPETCLGLGTSLMPTPKLRVERIELLYDEQNEGVPPHEVKVYQEDKTYLLVSPLEEESQVTQWDGEMISPSTVAARTKPVDTCGETVAQPESTR